MPLVSRWSELGETRYAKALAMLNLGRVFLIVAAAMVGVFGHSASFIDALAQFVPGMVHDMPAWFGRIGFAGAWQQIIQPILALPAWSPFVALGIVFVLLGLLRRR